jgi:S1-C subfamily serine protease
VATSLPPVRPGQYVYVIGNPGGSGIQLSIRGNDLIDHDDTKIHYKAPTDRGSSGSPVFDAAWALVGVHHAGGNMLSALHGATGTYAGNEGISIFAIRDALAAHPPTL